MTRPSVAGLLRRAGDIAGARAIRIASSLAFHVVAARLLGVAGYGALSHAVSGAAVAHQVTDLGAAPAVGVGLARDAGTGLNWLVVRRGALMKLAWVALFVAALLLKPEWGVGLFGNGMVWWGAALGVATGVAVLTEYVVVGLQRTRFLIVVSVLAYSIPILAGLLALLWIGTVRASVAWWACAMLAGLAVLWVRIARMGSTPPEKTRASAAGTGPSFARTAMLLGLTNLGAVLILRSPVIALGAAGRPEDAGLLGAGIAIVERAGVLGTAIGLSAGPALTGWTRDDHSFEAAVSLMRRGSEYALWLAAATAAVAPMIVPWVLGPSYSPLRSLLPALAPAVFLLACFQMTGGLLDFGGWVSQRSLAVAGSAALAVLALAVGGAALDPLWGAVLVAAGLGAVFVMIAAASFCSPDGHRVRAVFSVVGRDALRLGTVLLVVGTVRARVGPAGIVPDAALATAVAVALVLLTRKR